jgi:twitching motility protein PilT
MNNQEVKIEVLLEEVVRRKASDLHLQVGLPPYTKVDGTLTAIMGYDALDEQSI